MENDFTMIKLFYENPAYYFAPFVLILFLLIMGAKFFSSLYTGDIKILLKSDVIFATALVWPMSVTIFVTWSIFWLGGVLTGFLIGKQE
jgi:hypothetical protein